MNYTSMIAYADGAAGAGAVNGMTSLLNLAPFLLIFVVFYFLLIRPQNKKVKDHKKMVDALQKGDRVITAGGIYGTVSALKTDQDVVVLKVSDNAKIEIAKGSIQTVLVQNKSDEKANEK